MTLITRFNTVLKCYLTQHFWERNVWNFRVKAQKGETKKVILIFLILLTPQVYCLVVLVLLLLKKNILNLLSDGVFQVIPLLVKFLQQGKKKPCYVDSLLF